MLKELQLYLELKNNGITIELDLDKSFTFYTLITTQNSKNCPIYEKHENWIKDLETFGFNNEEITIFSNLKKYGVLGNNNTDIRLRPEYRVHSNLNTHRLFMNDIITAHNSGNKYLSNFSNFDCKLLLNEIPEYISLQEFLNISDPQVKQAYQIQNLHNNFTMQPIYNFIINAINRFKSTITKVNIIRLDLKSDKDNCTTLSVSNTKSANINRSGNLIETKTHEKIWIHELEDYINADCLAFDNLNDYDFEDFFKNFDSTPFINKPIIDTYDLYSLSNHDVFMPLYKLELSTQTKEIRSQILRKIAYLRLNTKPINLSDDELHILSLPETKECNYPLPEYIIKSYKYKLYYKNIFQINKNKKINLDEWIKLLKVVF